MRKFENNVQLLRYEVLREVAKMTLDGTLEKDYDKIPLIIIPGSKPRTRCCVHKERAIISDRVKLAMGGDKENPNIIETIREACDECPVQRFNVTDSCRGCIAHKCSEVCPKGAIVHVHGKAYIDSEKCIECGRCAQSCPYNAISDTLRPCVRACTPNAISIDEDKKAVIDNKKCIQCGACVYQCPFGAMSDKSSIVDVVRTIQKSKIDGTHVYAAIAPAIASQFSYARIEQVVRGVKMLGFHDVVEVALGADIVAMHEAHEFAETVDEKKLVTSSCCPAFVSYIRKNYPSLESKISNTVSPMVAIARLIKDMDKDAKIVFIGPCTAKKAEIQQDFAKEDVDYVLTFEELQALLDAHGISIEDCDDGPLNNASFYGRIFARSGGVADAVKHVAAAENIDVEFNPINCDGIKECDKALKLAKVNALKFNFIEGMACVGGCIGGAASLCHGPKDKKEVDKYASLAMETDVKDALRVLNLKNVNLDRE